MTRSVRPAIRRARGRPGRARLRNRTASPATCRKSRSPACISRLPIIGFASCAQERSTPTDMLTRRAFVRCGAACLLQGPRARSAPPPLFEEIPPAVSGLVWTHENALSAMRYMPEAFGPGCAFLDYDNDGLLDVFLGSYVAYGKAAQVPCFNKQLDHNYYCDPRQFQSTASLLFHNNGDGTFTEVGRATEIGFARGKALGVVATDINNDGLMDLFVANDTTANHLFVNRRGNWEEIALAAEVAFSADGQ